eukprot:gene7129-6744_t
MIVELGRALLGALALVEGWASLGLEWTASGSCNSTSDCYGLAVGCLRCLRSPCAAYGPPIVIGDCAEGRCVCDPWASAAPDCSAFSVDPVDFDPAP